MAKSSTINGPVVEVSGKSGDMERKWRAEDGLRTLTDAAKIKRDKSLMGDIDKARKAKMAELAGIECEVSPKTIGKK